LWHADCFMLIITKDRLIPNHDTTMKNHR
jgi:hypothetical protein